MELSKYSKELLFDLIWSFLYLSYPVFFLGDFRTHQFFVIIPICLATIYFCSAHPRDWTDNIHESFYLCFSLLKYICVHLVWLSTHQECFSLVRKCWFRIALSPPTDADYWLVPAQYCSCMIFVSSTYC